MTPERDRLHLDAMDASNGTVWNERVHEYREAWLKEQARARRLLADLASLLRSYTPETTAAAAGSDVRLRDVRSEPAPAEPPKKCDCRGCNPANWPETNGWKCSLHKPPQPADASRFICEKCGYIGPVQFGHLRPHGSGKCGYLASPAPAEPPQPAAPVLPDDIRDTLLRIGEVEWGATAPHDIQGHIEHLRRTLEITDSTHGQSSPTQMHGVYIRGTEIVLCHTGTSPNSPQHARIIVGAWNHLVQVSRNPVDDPPQPAAASPDLVGLLEAARDALRATYLLPRPWINGSLTWDAWDAAFVQIDNTLTRIESALRDARAEQTEVERG